jgi:beta-mannosidase
MLDTLDLGGAWRLTFTDHQRFGKPSQAEQEVTDESRFIDAQVPGEVHLDLLRAGMIPDPYVGANHLACRWVEEMEWSYRRFIDVPEAATKGRAWLYFECLDLVARVVLNGQEVGKQSNSFHPARIDVTGKLKPGRNLLLVHLESGLYSVADKPMEGYNGHIDQRLHKRHWLRKPQSEFGWDWSPRLINVGLQGAVRLEWTADAARVDRLVPLVTVSDDLARGEVRARVFVEGLAAQPTPAKVRVEIPELKATAEAEIQVAPGLNPYEVTVRVDRPKLWWPVGHGEQPLYRLRAVVSAGGKELATREARIGFRRVRIDQSPHPVSGSNFIVEINNRRVFCKGGNFVPADLFRAAITKERYRSLVDLALEANFNLLRVWGGGLYESDAFYDLCDERGILVWQEFIFACSKYPGHDEGFRDNVRNEAIHNIRRLASHASLFAWCGNNEIEQGYWSWGYDKGQVLSCHQLYHHLFPRLLDQEDPTRYYQPSSPYSPGAKDPTADDRGDQHPWSLGFGDTDFRKYRAMYCRFPNEGGTLGPVSLPTLKRCMPTPSQQKPASFEWHCHDNSIATWHCPSATDGMSAQHLGKDLRKMGLEEAVFWTGLLQGEGLKEYCDNFRRRMFTESSAAIFWMYNDVWPATRSWTIVDHGLRRTPAFHHVRRALAPVSVVLAEVGDEVGVFGVNDTQEAIAADLRYGAFAIAGGWPIDRSAKVTLAPNASTKLASFKRSEWKDPNAMLAAAVLTRDGAVIARNRLALPFFKELAWAPARVQVAVKDGAATFTSEGFAWGVCLDLDGEGTVADNLFDVYPGVPHRIPWTRKDAPRILHIGNLASQAAAKG